MFVSPKFDLHRRNGAACGLERARVKARTDKANRLARAASAKLFGALEVLAMLLAVLALGLMVFSVFAFAADRALTMPMHIEGF
jgi:hypothetical protein